MIGLFSLRSYHPPDQLPDRLACNWMLISAALAVAFHYDHLPFWLSATAACVLLWRYFIENHAWHIPGRLVRWSLLLLTGVLIFRHYGVLSGRDAGVALLVLLLTLKILEIRTLRDYLLAVFLIYLTVLGAFLFSQTLSTGAYAGLVIVVTTHALVLLNRPQPLTQGQSLRLVVVLLLQSLPLLLILYLLFPRIQGSLWGLPRDAFTGRTGMSEQVSPGSINRLYNDDTVAFRVEFDGQRPPPADLYWRVLVLSKTDGRVWQRHHGPGDGDPEWSYLALDTPKRYSVTLEPHHQHWLPALDLPGAAAPNNGVRSTPGYTLESTRPVRQLRRYDLLSNLRYTTTGLTPQESAHNRLWPGTPSPRVLELLQTFKRDASTPRELVVRVLRHFNQQPFRYTLEPPLLSGDPVDSFLFESQAGYCEHYATAFAALMRLSQIPARLVVGYQGGEWNQTGRYLVVRQSDAHAWAEVWLPGTGWTRVDPTAAVAPERIELGADALRRLIAEGAGIGLLPINQAKLLIAPSWASILWRDLTWRWDTINSSWNRWVMAYGPKAQLQFLKLIGMRTPSWFNIAASMALALILALLFISALWIHARRTSDPVARLYQRFCAKLKRIGIERQQTEGPLDFANRLALQRDDLRDPVNRITRLYISLRYGRGNRGAITELRRQVSAFKATAQPLTDSSSRSG